MGYLFSELFDMAGCAKSTILYAKDTVADLLEPKAETIVREIIAKKVPIHLDGSAVKTRDGKTCKTSQAWLLPTMTSHG